MLKIEIDHAGPSSRAHDAGHEPGFLVAAREMSAKLPCLDGGQVNIFTEYIAFLKGIYLRYIAAPPIADCGASAVPPPLFCAPCLRFKKNLKK